MLMAFFTSGRFIVRVTMCPSRSVRSAGSVIGSSDGECVSDVVTAVAADELAPLDARPAYVLLTRTQPE